MAELGLRSTQSVYRRPGESRTEPPVTPAVASPAPRPPVTRGLSAASGAVAAPNDRLSTLLARAVAERRDASALQLTRAPRGARRSATLQRLVRHPTGVRSDDGTAIVTRDRLLVLTAALDDGRVDLDELQGARVGPGSSTGGGSGSFVKLTRGQSATISGANWTEIVPRFTDAPLQHDRHADPRSLAKFVTDLTNAYRIDPSQVTKEDVERLIHLRKTRYWIRTLYVNQDGAVDDSEDPQTSNVSDVEQHMAGPADCESFSALAQGTLTKGNRRVSYVARVDHLPVTMHVPSGPHDYSDKSIYRNEILLPSGRPPAHSAGQALADEAMVQMILPWIHDPTNAAYLQDAHKELKPGDNLSVTRLRPSDGIVEVVDPAAHTGKWRAWAQAKLLALYTNMTAEGRRSFDEAHGQDAVRDDPLKVQEFIHKVENASYLTAYHRTLQPGEERYFLLDEDDDIITFDTTVSEHNARNLRERGVKRAKDLYWALSDEGRRKFDKDHGINDYVDPSLGQAYLIATQEDAEGFEATSDDKAWWGQHWGTVVMVRGTDKIALEGYADQGRQAELRASGRLKPGELLQVRDAKFAMYAGINADTGEPTQQEETFAARHLATKLHGNRALTFMIVTI